MQQDDKTEKIPQHVAIIMDGNGRWAERHGFDRSEGHVAGVESVRKILKAASKLGIKYITLYAFSTENWGRPKQEVDMLMELFCTSIINETPNLIQEGVKVKLIGDKNGLSQKVCEHIDKIESDTANCNRLTLVLALNYSSRTEITQAVAEITKKVENGLLRADDIDKQTINDTLYTTGIPDPDLLIRTSGECRLSNFLLWQSAYSELYFTPTLWPDFDEKSLAQAVSEYQKRDRRYGLLKERKTNKY